MSVPVSGGTRSPVRRRRRGLVRRSLRLVAAGRETVDATLELGRAEARLARHALRPLAVWTMLGMLFGSAVLAGMWTAALFGLWRWLHSWPLALSALVAICTGAFAVAAWQTRRLLRCASFPESRRRLALFLGADEPDSSGDHDDAGPGTP